MRQLLLVVALACFGTAWAQTPVAQVSNDGTNWTPFEQLITGNSETGAFDYANTLSGDVVIELLLETDASYTLTSSFTFNKSGMSSLTLRTAATVGQRATLKKDQTSGSMIVINSSGTNLTVQDVIFDGNNKNSGGNGGAIRQSQSNNVVTIIDCDFVNCKSQSQGGAVYSYGNVVVQCTQDHSVNFEGCVGTYGGAICSDKSHTLTNYGTISFVDCSASNDGGAIRIRTGITINNYGSLSFTNCDSYCGGAMENNDSGATTINNTGTLMIDGCDASSYSYGGGGIAAYRGPLLITNSGTMSITNCTSGYSGGGIAVQNDAMTITGTAANQVTITNCSSPTKGGGVYVAYQASLSGCTITDCSAPQGGGLYANSNANLTNCTITGCSATTVGGGVYVGSTSLTLGNSVSITDNTLGNTTVTNGAGIYMANTSGVINIADNGEGAYIAVYNNYTSNNQCSDTKTGNTVPPFQITAASLTGLIGVANAGANSLYLAHSTVSHVCGDPIQNVFVDDAGTYNCNEYYDEAKSIYWGITSETPICKITDADGYLLYRGSNGSDDPEAVFPLLEYAFAASQEAFTHANGTAATPAHIEMIVSDYTQNSALNVSNMALTLKTAGVNPPDGNYPGPENNAIITRGVFTNSMFVMRNSANLSLENLIIDGNDVTATTNGGIIRVESSNCHLALNEGTVLKRGLSNSYGGAMYVADNAVFSMSGATIDHCSARTGGAVYIDGTSGTANTIENSTFSYCNATGTYNSYQNYEHGGGAVRSLKPIAVSSTADKQTLFDHCTSSSYGGAIYASTVTLTNDGTVSFVDCNAPRDGGALCTLNGITINNYSQLSFTNCDSQCGGAMENNNSGFITINNTGTLTIEGCDANSVSYGGGGIAVYKGSLSITNSGTMSITSCTSAFGGGGIYVNSGATTIIGGSTATNQMTISNCTAPQGGGIYTDGTSLTLGNTISITGNTINNTTVSNGAGIYMANANGVITIADDGNGANITVYGNTTSDDQPSDIKTGKTVQPFEITATSLTGQIGVANTSVAERSLGQSTVSQVLGDPIQNVFIDNCGNYDYIEYKGDDQDLIYWYSNVYHFITDGLWSEAANWQDGTVPYNNVDEVFIEAACQLDQDANVGTLTVTEGTLSLLSGNILTVNAVLTNTAAEALVIKDGAQLINASPNVVATVEKDITAYSVNNPDGWYTIASPVNSMTIEGSDFLSPKYDLYRFNETNLTHDEWENYKNGIHEDFTTFENGRGYLYANSNTVSPAFVGTLNNASVTYRITYTSNRPDNLKGFNLIGNPFPHVIYKGSGCAISNSYLASGYYTLTNDDAWQVHTDDEAIQPTQGILVKNTYASRNLTINKMATSGNSKVVTPRMDISVTGASGSDRCFAYFCEGIGLDKINNLNENAPSLSIRNEGQDYAIAHLDGQTELLDVMFNNKKAGNYYIAIEGNGMSFEYLHLIDNITGADVDLLRQPVYTFHATGKEYAARFKVVFKPMTGVEENQQENFCFVNGETLYVNIETDGGLLTLTDVLGRVVKSVNLNGTTCSISGLQSGVYIVRLTDGAKSFVQKVVINH